MTDLANDVLVFLFSVGAVVCTGAALGGLLLMFFSLACEWHALTRKAKNDDEEDTTQPGGR